MTRWGGAQESVYASLPGIERALDLYISCVSAMLPYVMTYQVDGKLICRTVNSEDSKSTSCRDGTPSTAPVEVTHYFIIISAIHPNHSHVVS